MSGENRKNIGDQFEALVEIMARLRAADGCPWDREQTHRSLRQYLLEETYEVLEALDENNMANLREELGDLLLQILFHAQIAEENKAFEVGDVIEAIREKLIRRHPNVFGDVLIETSAEQSKNWERLKQAEGKESIIDGVPRALSGLLRAFRIQQKASTVGFDWESEEPVWDKIHEEIEELKALRQDESHSRLEDEFGDLLFSLVNLARVIKLNPEDCIRRSTEKFIRRFQALEKEFRLDQRLLHEASLTELDAYWEKIKAEEK